MLTVSLVRRTYETPRPSPGAWRLSPKEGEVVRLVQRGLSNKEIADELSISLNTVKTHLRAVFDKAGVRTRMGLMAALSVPPASNSEAAKNTDRTKG